MATAAAAVANRCGPNCDTWVMITASGTVSERWVTKWRRSRRVDDVETCAAPPVRRPSKAGARWGPGGRSSRERFTILGRLGPLAAACIGWSLYIGGEPAELTNPPDFRRPLAAGELGPMSLSQEQRALLRWGEPVRRPLPWRSSRDPWAILVSEVMAQQTQVDRVVERWEQFLQRWPTPDAAASAKLSEILGVWQGLGYPRRAKALWESARVIAEAGRFPSELDDLLALPGVGPYTARAVQAFAFERDVGVVDTNIARVLARRCGRRLSQREAQREADEFVAAGHGWAHNQSLMDLGNRLCRPRPDCEQCPLSSWCVWANDRGSLPDPAIGSAGVSTRQAPFEGSDRQARGRLLSALQGGGVRAVDAHALMGFEGDLERARSIVDSLIRDGLVIVDGELLRLP